MWVLTKRNENAQKVEFSRRNSNQPRSQGLSSFFAQGGREDEKPWKRGWLQRIKQALKYELNNEH